VEAFGHDMPESAANFVPDHRAADRAAHGETDSGGLVDVISALQVQNHTRPSGTIAAPHGRGELFSPPHPMIGRQHGRASDRDASAPLATP
jgi:hypothetical protein